MHLEFSPSRTLGVVSPSGEQDIATADGLRQASARACQASELVVLDFRDVTFADSSVLGLIAKGARDCTASGSRLIVINAYGVVDKAIRLTGLQVYYADPVPEHADLQSMLHQA